FQSDIQQAAADESGAEQRSAGDVLRLARGNAAAARFVEEEEEVSGSVMAEAPPVVEIDPDFEPLSRPRSCTWPLPRPDFNPSNSANSSPAPEPPSSSSSSAGAPGNVDFMSNLSLLEESEDYDPGVCGDFQCQELHQLQPQPHQQPGGGGGLHAPPSVSSLSPSSSPSPLGAQQPRKSSSSRRNAWGNLSYADLISQAIESSPEKRLTLSQIYDWMVKSVPYFKDKGDSNSSAGWKVSSMAPHPKNSS
ncbi:hypothetical protein AB205_0015790, partial [Aquarana catesbeiana]